MKREIKFRAWTGAQMEYKVLVGLLGAFYVQGLDPNDSACISPMNTKYSDETPIMQFTGLHDKNGKEIYEGDILRSSSVLDSPRICEVIFKDAQFRVVYPQHEFDSTLSFFVGLMKPKQAEVIGNIYETPDLIK